MDAEPPIASFLKSMLIGGGPVNAAVRRSGIHNRLWPISSLTGTSDKSTGSGLPFSRSGSHLGDCEELHLTMQSMTMSRCHIVRRNTRIEKNRDYVRSVWHDLQKTPKELATNIGAKLVNPNSNPRFDVLLVEHIASGQAPADNAVRVVATQYDGCLHSRKTRRTFKGLDSAVNEEGEP